MAPGMTKWAEVPSAGKPCPRLPAHQSTKEPGGGLVLGSPQGPAPSPLSQGDRLMKVKHLWAAAGPECAQHMALRSEGTAGRASWRRVL